MGPLIGVSCALDDESPSQGLRHWIRDGYISAVVRAGGVPVALPVFGTEVDFRGLLVRLDGILLSGGGDISPDLYGGTHVDDLSSVNIIRDKFEIELTRIALDLNVPVLAICRGMQVMNVSCGGTLIQDIPTEMPDALKHQYSFPNYPRDHMAHLVQVVPGSRLERCLAGGEVEHYGKKMVCVNSRHHQALSVLGQGLEVVAQSPDGIVEAVEYSGDGFAVGVQWHPEDLAEEHLPMQQLFESFVEAASLSMLKR